MNKNLDRISRHLSKLLRHDSEDLIMDDKGWINTSSILKKFDISLDDLNYIVDTNNKKRFIFNDDLSKIRATQGHSKGIAENKEFILLSATQTEFKLYHGTDKNTADKILNSSINTGKRNHVHWTTNKELAKKRSNQRFNQTKNEGVLIVLNTKKYIEDGNDVFISENEVYLTNEVSKEYLNIEYITY